MPQLHRSVTCEASQINCTADVCFAAGRKECVCVDTNQPYFDIKILIYAVMFGV
jgi:hypothetical protein